MFCARYSLLRHLDPLGTFRKDKEKHLRGLTEYCQPNGTFDGFADEIRTATSQSSIAAGRARSLWLQQYENRPEIQSTGFYTMVQIVL